MPSRGKIEIGTGFNAQKTDHDRFRFMLDHKGIFSLMLDNDLASTIYSVGALSNFSEDQIKILPDLNDFDNYLDGKLVIPLLGLIGIKAEYV